jgi:OmpA family
MMYRLVFVCITMLPLASTGLFAQQAFSEPSADVAFWVAYWGQPRVVLFGTEEETFNRNMHEIMFPWNDHAGPSNPSALDENAQWLKDHPSGRFYIYGYASSRGELIYNLALSQRRADWVKQALISKGIPDNRIGSGSGMGAVVSSLPGTQR